MSSTVTLLSTGSPILPQLLVGQTAQRRPASSRLATWGTTLSGLTVTCGAAAASAVWLAPSLVSPLPALLALALANKLLRCTADAAGARGRFAAWSLSNVLTGIAIGALSPGVMLSSGAALAASAACVCGAAALAYALGVLHKPSQEAVPARLHGATPMSGGWHTAILSCCLLSIWSPPTWPVLGLIAGASASRSLSNVYVAGQYSDSMSSQKLGLCLSNNIVNAFVAAATLTPRVA